MNVPQRSSKEVKFWKNGEIYSSVTPRKNKNGFIKFDDVAMIALNVLQSCAATASSSDEMCTRPPLSINAYDFL